MKVRKISREIFKGKIYLNFLNPLCGEKEDLMPSITRRAARECALKALFSYEFHPDADPNMHFALVCAEAEIPTNDFAASLFCGVVELTHH